MTEAIQHLQSAQAAFILTLLPFLITALFCNGLIHRHCCEVGYRWCKLGSMW